MRPEQKKNVKHRLQGLILEVMVASLKVLRSEICVLSCKGAPSPNPSRS